VGAERATDAPSGFTPHADVIDAGREYAVTRGVRRVAQAAIGDALVLLWLAIASLDK
jgi:hypothetical protein